MTEVVDLWHETCKMSSSVISVTGARLLTYHCYSVKNRPSVSPWLRRADVNTAYAMATGLKDHVLAAYADVLAVCCCCMLPSEEEGSLLT